MNISINRLHYPVTALGPGRRIGIWVQGCSIGCRGCASRDTWPASAETRVEISAIVQWCLAKGGEADGVTISGGEPFEQPEALEQLLRALDAWRRDEQRDIDFLCYSGLPAARLRRDFPSLLDQLDAIVPEPFVERLPTDAAWRGSANQPLLPLSPLGRRLYGADGALAGAAEGRMQVAVAEGQVWLIGIPRRGDLDRLLEAGERRGVTMEAASWRA